LKTLKPEEIARLRLHNHHLVGERFASPLDVLRAYGAIQAQEFAVAKWSLAQRSEPGLTDAAVEVLFAQGKFLRTHVLRPTWHFVAAEDLRWIVELTAPRVHQANAYYYRKLELDEKLVARSQNALEKALRGGKQLDRKEVAAVFSRAGIDAQGLRFAYFLIRAELDLLIASGALRGKQQTYALLDERVPKAKKRSTEESLAELTRRYFFTHGPATLKDFAWWSSLTVKDIKRALGLVDGELESFESEGRVYYLRAPEKAVKAPAPRAHLLQGYDEYVIAYSESRDVLNLRGRAGIVPAGKVQYTHAVTIDGQVVGHWRRAENKGAAIEAYFAEPLSAKEERAYAAELDTYRQFLAR
jgi:hypothetical protein